MNIPSLHRGTDREAYKNKMSTIYTAQKMKFSIKDFFSKCDQIRRKLRICSHLLKKSLMENFIFCAVLVDHYIKTIKAIPALFCLKYVMKNIVSHSSIDVSMVVRMTVWCCKDHK